MKRFILNISIISTIIAVLLLWISTVDISDDYIIHKTYGTDYHKIAYNINLINRHSEKIQESVVFLGPSVVEQGICDSTMLKNGIKTVNLGINHPGREIELYFLNRVLKYKPKSIYIFTNWDWDHNFHSLTPLLYNPCQLISYGQSFNNHLFEYFIKRVTFCLDYLTWNLTNKENKELFFSNYGVNSKKNMSEDEYNRIKKSHLVVFSNDKAHDRKTLFDILTTVNNEKNAFITRYKESFYNKKSTRRFLEKMIELSNTNNIQMSSIYIPAFLDVMEERKHDRVKYFSNTKIKIYSLETFTFLDRYYYWRDMGHLSKKGAPRFTSELISAGFFNNK